MGSCGDTSKTELLKVMAANRSASTYDVLLRRFLDGKVLDFDRLVRLLHFSLTHDGSPFPGFVRFGDVVIFVALVNVVRNTNLRYGLMPNGRFLTKPTKATKITTHSGARLVALT